MSTKYTKELLEEAVSKSVSFAGVLRYLGIKQAGGNHSHITKMIRRYEIDTSHFTGQGHNRGSRAPNRRTPEDIFKVLPEGSNRENRVRLERALRESGVPYRCALSDCPSPEPMWRGKSLTLEIDHYDGNKLNNQKDNLRFLCPNCHRQQPTTGNKYFRVGTGIIGKTLIPPDADK